MFSAQPLDARLHSSKVYPKCRFIVVHARIHDVGACATISSEQCTLLNVEKHHHERGDM